jgi:hypothetical protein
MNGKRQNAIGPSALIRIGMLYHRARVTGCTLCNAKCGETVRQRLRAPDLHELPVSHTRGADPRRDPHLAPAPSTARLRAEPRSAPIPDREQGESHQPNPIPAKPAIESRLFAWGATRTESARRRVPPSSIASPRVHRDLLFNVPQRFHWAFHRKNVIRPFSFGRGIIESSITVPHPPLKIPAQSVI